MRNGSGTYIPPVNSWSPAVNGNSATPTDFNALLSDIASAISQSISADGQTPITADIPMSGNKITGLAQGTASGQAVAWEQLFSLGVEQDVASAATTDIGAVNSTFIRITGTTTITSFGTNYRGPRFVRFGGVLQLTHNATTLILPGSANITTAAGDSAIIRPVGSPGAGWIVSHFQRASALPALQGQVATLGANTFTGAQTLPGNAANSLEAVPKQQLDSGLLLVCPPATIKAMARLTAPSGWLLVDGKTIGNASSGATARANADTWLLYEQVWAFPVASVPIFTSAGAPTTRGVSAAADFAAGRRLALFTPDGGAFLRMWTPGQTVDSGRVVGSAQAASRVIVDWYNTGAGRDTIANGGFQTAAADMETGSILDTYRQVETRWIGSIGGADEMVTAAGRVRPYSLAMPHYIFLGVAT